MSEPTPETYADLRESAPTRIRPLLLSLATWLRDLMLSCLIAVLVILFLYRPVKVEGTSMMPSLFDQERLFINQFTYKFGIGESSGAILSSSGFRKIPPSLTLSA